MPQLFVLHWWEKKSNKFIRNNTLTAETAVQATRPSIIFLP